MGQRRKLRVARRTRAVGTAWERQAYLPEDQRADERHARRQHRRNTLLHIASCSVHITSRHVMSCLSSYIAS